MNEFSDQGGSDGILAMGWGSGTGNFPYLISPLEGIQERARQDGSSVFWDFDDWNTALAGNMAFDQAIALVFTTSNSGEDYITVDGNEGDQYIPHTFLSDVVMCIPCQQQPHTAWHNGDDLIFAVVAQNNNTIVVVNSIGPLILISLHKLACHKFLLLVPGWISDSPQ
ncbi:hypothetical protein BDR03DRAFT_1046171 [Suillus americanus]|nr:hypothetical protein BDR03DRAFT_1046171 [Suillus americanus]